MARDPEDPDEAEELALAVARLAWVQAAGCQQLASQREALEWHQTCADAQLAALERRQINAFEPR